MSAQSASQSRLGVSLTPREDFVATRLGNAREAVARRFHDAAELGSTRFIHAAKRFDGDCHFGDALVASLGRMLRYNSSFSPTRQCDGADWECPTGYQVEGLPHGRRAFTTCTPGGLGP
jgi:hypothetical protein